MQLLMHLACPLPFPRIRNLLPHAAQPLSTMQGRPDVWGARCGEKQSTAEDAVRIVLKQRQLGEQEKSNMAAALCYLRRLRCAGQAPCGAIAVQRQFPARRPGLACHCCCLLPLCCRLRSELGPELMERHGEALEMLEQMHNRLRPEVKASDVQRGLLGRHGSQAALFPPTRRTDRREQLPSHVQQAPEVQGHPRAAACSPALFSAGASGGCAG